MGAPARGPRRPGGRAYPRVLQHLLDAKVAVGDAVPQPESRREENHGWQPAQDCTHRRFRVRGAEDFRCASCLPGRLRARLLGSAVRGHPPTPGSSPPLVGATACHGQRRRRCALKG